MRFTLPRVRFGVRVPVLAACLAFAASSPGWAGPIELSTQFWYEGATFNGTAFHAQDSLSLGALGGLMRGPCIGGGPDCAMALRGTMEILTGPLLDHQFFPGDGVSVDDVNRYVYGAGNIRLTAEWDLPGGGTGHGGFVAPIPVFAFDVTEVPAKGDVFWNSDNPLGPGLFDPALAAYLHVAPGTTGGTFQLVADVYGRQDPLDRVAAFTGAPLSIDAAAPIPEPSLLLLLGLGVAGLAARQRRIRNMQ